MLLKIQRVLTVMMLAITIMGLVTFSLFIFEEAMQTVMFGTWAAQDAKNWQLVKKGIETNKRFNKTMKTINYCAGWIQPLAFLSYRAYGESMDYYNEALESKVFAHAPELYEGSEIKFSAKNAEVLKDGRIRLYTGRLSTIIDTPAPALPVEISGIIVIRDGRIIVE